MNFLSKILGNNPESQEIIGKYFYMSFFEQKETDFLNIKIIETHKIENIILHNIYPTGAHRIEIKSIYKTHIFDLMRRPISKNENTFYELSNIKENSHNITLFLSKEDFAILKLGNEEEYGMLFLKGKNELNLFNLYK